jgi:type II secretory pathway pseudopilin PulG
MTTRATADETGSTLVEIVVVIVLLGAAVATMLGALATAIRTSANHRASAIAGALVANAAEIIIDPSTPYVACADGTSYASALLPQSDPSITLTVVSVTYWERNVPATFSAPCSADPGVQLIRVRASSADGTALEELEFTKRRPGT